MWYLNKDITFFALYDQSIVYIKYIFAKYLCGEHLYGEKLLYLFY